MNKMIIAACGVLMAASTFAIAQDAENTHSDVTTEGHTLTGKKKTKRVEKTKIKTATGSANAKVTTTKVQERDGHVTETKSVEAEGMEKK